MRLSRAPAHPQSQAPESNRAGRPYESRRDQPTAWESTTARVAEEGIAPSRPIQGPSVLSAVCLLFHHSARRDPSSSPCGNRTRLSSLRGWCPGR